jgi:hypothetical protein
MLTEGCKDAEQSKKFRAVQRVLDRCIKAKLIEDPLTPHKFVSLLSQRGFELPTELISEVDAVTEKRPKVAAPKDRERVAELEIELHPKVPRSLIKLVMTMAKAKYGYEPDKRGVVAKISGDSVELGLELDHKTIKKWLENCDYLIKNKNLQK